MQWFDGYWFVKLHSNKSLIVQNNYDLFILVSDTQQDSPFLRDLFYEERINIEWLINRDVVTNISSYSPPKCRFHQFPSEMQKSNVENELEMATTRNYYDIGGDLARPSMLSVKSPLECCNACSDHPLCTSWSFFQLNDTNSNPLPPWLIPGCTLKGSAPESSVPLLGAYSGKVLMHGLKPNPANELIAFEIPRPSAPRAIIFHGTSCFYRNESITFYKRDVNTILIGRYMVERSEFAGGFTNDEFYVAHCAGLMDEVWVPTEWHREVFSVFMQQMGLQAPMIAVVPEAVDTNLFNPFEDVAIANAELSTQCVYQTTSSSKHCHIREESGSIMCNNPTDRFVFLSVFKWEHRKGWDTLLTAYWDAFTAMDQVELQIRSYLPSSDRNGDKNITRQIERYALSSRGKPLHELAAVVWLAGSISRSEMRDLYKQADAFVLSTKGEGWGLPVAEAMAMALPVIVTNYSGPTAYATVDNAYLIALHDPPNHLDELSYCRPNEKHLTKLMRQVIIDSTTSHLVEEWIQEKESNDSSVIQCTVSVWKGLLARKTMRETFSAVSVVSSIVDRLRVHAYRRGWVF
mmetsp:Transcript_31975/g.46058  ORF Transcript_31975/g.46058 Transcript_31975/m.46058 type:complete len:576 (-) Transcript_31975:151-1878(-)